MRRGYLVPLFLALSVAACHKNKPVVEAPPQPGPPSPAPTNPPPAPPAPAPSGGNNASAITAAVAAEVGNVIHFDLDKDIIKDEDKPVLDAKAAIMKANPALRIRISGHADDRGSDEYNLVLGNKRSLAAKQYLMGKGIDGSRIDVTSFGEERPVDPADNEAAWAKNRRDEFEIIAGGDRLVRPQ